MANLTKKQQEVMDCFIKENPKILVASGAKRAGKTFVFILLFLMHISKYENKGLNFIIGGANQASIRRNILTDMERVLGKELKLNKSNAVTIFGNTVYCFDGAQSDSWKKARGFTAAGALLNEGTALHDVFIKEVISRCSYAGSKILIDTNPQNPAHSVKKDYIDNDGQRLDNGRLNIKAFDFILSDNDQLDPEYVESIIAATPSGVFTERDIYGKWVAADGVVYQDFNKDKHYIKYQDFLKIEGDIIKYFAGVDWGYSHHGSIVVIGEDSKGNFYLVEEIAEQNKEIDWWVEQAYYVEKKYGRIDFWSDSARVEHVERFHREGFRAHNARKAVIAGIEEVSMLFKQDKFFVVKDNVKRFDEEIYMYVWDEKTGMPKKIYDDVLDAVRYAIYSNNEPYRRRD